MLSDLANLKKMGLFPAYIGGLIVSQILTLYLTPILYLYLEKLRERVLKK